MSNKSQPKPDRDTLFLIENGNRDFTFDSKTAGVFDDMVQRSVPFYEEIQRMTCELAGDFAVNGTRLYDIGCATGTTLQTLDPILDPSIEFVGVDNSEDMLAKARDKLKHVAERRPLTLINSDIHARFGGNDDPHPAVHQTPEPGRPAAAD